MDRSEMNSLSHGSAMKRRLSLAFMPALLVAVPLMAQQVDTVKVRVVSTWQKDVDQRRLELLQLRKLELELYRMLSTIEARRRAAADSQRTDLQAQSRLLFGRLREAGVEQIRIRRELETMCSEVRKPEGWLGVATTGIQLVDRQGDGSRVVTFLEPPIVASIDPGSPADRVGLRAGDVLVEIGGKRLLQSSVVFAELLRVGEKIVIKVRRAGEVLSVMPMVEPLPEVTGTPCAWVDAGTAYVISPMPQVRAQGQPSTGGGGFAYSYTRPRRDSTGGAEVAPPPAGAVYAGPMAQLYSGGASSLAGLQLVTLNEESSRAFGVTHGLFVAQVLPGTPGREAGLQGGDVMISADSVDLRSISSLQRVINRSRDRTVSLMIVRDRKVEKVQLRW